MLDPTLGFAMSIHSSKGVYALLLGSGLSRSSAIPTGWEVVIDLIRKLAHLKNESCEPDPEAWYRGLTGTEPDYSDILDQVTLSSTERLQLLRSYFEATPEERDEGRKAPSPAHRAIATLIAKGYVRVIVTTNFDRLLEQALSEAGVQPTVISTADAVQGALPLTHSTCTIVKVHGDYLDSRLRNTKAELSAYEKPLDELLDRIFDEFGLVVCGWSGEWDIALRAAIERCSTRRFGTYWASRGKLGPTAEKLVGLRRASVITISDADSLFRDLSEKISALEQFSIVDPVSPRVAVARLKRYLASPEQRISLRDLLNSETERVYAAISGPRFPMEGRAVGSEDLLARLRAYEAELHTLLPLMVCGAYWAEVNQYELLTTCLKRLADAYGRESGLTAWLSLKKYPAVVLLYAMGLAAMAHRNFPLLKNLLGLSVRTVRRGGDELITEVLNPVTGLERDLGKLLPGREREFTPFNNHLFEILREPLREFLPDEVAYDQMFDLFEYMMGLAHCDQTVSQEELDKGKTADKEWYIWGPVGRFAWKRGEGNIMQQTELRQGELYPETVAGILRAGFFGSGGTLNDERYRLVKRGFDTLVGKVRAQWGAW